MGKKKNKKKNKLKAQILSASQSFSRADNYTPTPIGTPASPSFNTSPAVFPAGQAVHSNAASVVIKHINTDLRFFLFVTIAMAVILIALYFWDQQAGIVLQMGRKLYEILGLS